ncbi:cytochrome c biogenesis protein CcdA, partial [Planctomycetota bacterium]
DWLKPILLALAAGLLLNLMPCVLPVIPLKVLSLIQQSQADISQGDRYKPVKLAAVFSGGIIVVFVGLAVIMSVFKMLYGQQFQSDAFKLVMLVIIFILSLSMFGIFEVVVPGRIANVNIVREGYLGATGCYTLNRVWDSSCWGWRRI